MTTRATTCTPPRPKPPECTISILSTAIAIPVVKDTPRKKRLRLALDRLRGKVRQKNAEIKRLQKQVKKSGEVESLIESIRSFLTPDEHLLVATQMRLSVGKKKWYPEEFKTFAVSVFFKSPSCYRFLATRFKLPSVRTINLWLSKLHFEEDICPNLLELLKLRVSRLKQEDRVAILLADEISLKEAVDYSSAEDRVFGVKKPSGQDQYLDNALVLMVSGLQTRWKQAFAYFFEHSAVKGPKLKDILEKAILELINVGLDVVALCTDQGSNFDSFLKSCGVTKERPYLVIGGRIIYVFSDPPHVLKSTRNCLARYDIHTSTGVAKWRVIKEFYELDKKCRVRSCPKLKDSHFKLDQWTDL